MFRTAAPVIDRDKIDAVAARLDLSTGHVQRDYILDSYCRASRESSLRRGDAGLPFLRALPGQTGSARGRSTPRAGMATQVLGERREYAPLTPASSALAKHDTAAQLAALI
jgi:hypothetical protein